jgi:hypothetical protein
VGTQKERDLSVERKWPFEAVTSGKQGRRVSQDGYMSTDSLNTQWKSFGKLPSKTVE